MTTTRELNAHERATLHLACALDALDALAPFDDDEVGDAAHHIGEALELMDADVSLDAAENLYRLEELRPSEMGDPRGDHDGPRRLTSAEVRAVDIFGDTAMPWRTFDKPAHHEQQSGTCTRRRHFARAVMNVATRIGDPRHPLPVAGLDEARRGYGRALLRLDGAHAAAECAWQEAQR